MLEFMRELQKVIAYLCEGILWDSFLRILFYQHLEAIW